MQMDLEQYLSKEFNHLDVINDSFIEYVFSVIYNWKRAFPNLKMIRMNCTLKIFIKKIHSS